MDLINQALKELNKAMFVCDLTTAEILAKKQAVERRLNQYNSQHNKNSKRSITIAFKRA